MSKQAESHEQLRCPFCGSDNQELMSIADNDGDFESVTCHDCKAQGPWRATEDEAEKAWDTQPGISYLRQDLARYENGRVIMTGELDRLRQENLQLHQDLEAARDRMARWAQVMIDQWPDDVTESHSGRPWPGETSACLPADDRGVVEARSSEGGIGGTECAAESIQSRELVDSNPVPMWRASLEQIHAKDVDPATSIAAHEPKDELCQQLRDWYERGFIQVNAFRESEAKLLWEAIQALGAENESQASALPDAENIGQPSHEPTTPREDDRPALIHGVAVKNGKCCVIGQPAYYAQLPDDHPWQHNCDAMGCNSVEHMLWRGSVQDQSTAQPPGSLPYIQRASAMQDVLEDLDSLFDKQTREDKLRHDFDVPDDFEHTILITAKQIRAVTAAIVSSAQPQDDIRSSCMEPGCGRYNGEHAPGCPRPDMNHPKIQGLIGGQARLKLELQIIESMLEPDYEADAIDGEYWTPLHDKLSARLAQPPAVDWRRLRNEIGSHILEDKSMADTLAIALCTYFEDHPDRPDPDPNTEHGWGQWAEHNADRVMNELADVVFKRLGITKRNDA